MEKYKVNDNFYIDSLFELGAKMCLNPDLMEDVFNSTSFRIWLMKKEPIRHREILNVFSNEKTSIEGLFKVSYLLNPSHGFVYGGYKYESYSKLGEAFLSNSPDINPTLLELYKNKLLLWYMEMNKDNLVKKDLYEKIKNISINSKYDEKTSYFLLGYILSNDHKFYFENKKYDSISDFYNYISKDEKLLQRYDLSTQACLKAWYIYTNDINKLEFIESLLDTNRTYLEICIKSLNLK